MPVKPAKVKKPLKNQPVKKAAPTVQRKAPPKSPAAKPKAKSRIDRFMAAAIADARKGLAEGGIPIGAALERKGKLVATGHNKRVQNGDPVTHGETDCLRNAGRLGSYRGCTLYSTLMPCYFCAGAAVQFGIKKVVVGESRNFPGAPEFMREHGIEVVDLDLPECYEMMGKFIEENPGLWNEDFGVD
jgi:cytosine deaminase